MGPFIVYGALYSVWGPLGCMGHFRVYGALQLYIYIYLLLFVSLRNFVRMNFLFPQHHNDGQC